MTNQKDVLNFVWEQTGIYFEPLKPKDWRSKLTLLRNNCQEITPPAGTQIEDRLKEELFQYCVNGPRARERIQINSGSCLTEEGFHYFKFSSFVNFVK